MGKASKATKKFQKNHLGRELTKRKHDQKKKAIREKSLEKYAPKEGEDGGDDDDDEDEEAGGNGVAQDEADVFSTKAKSKPMSARAAPKAAAARPATYVKPPAKKAPSIEDVDVDQFMDGAFLDDESNPKFDDRVLDEDDDEEEDAGEDGEEMEDEENAEFDAENAALEAEIAAHEAELANLSKVDPEFFSHLQQHDKDLLAFSREEFDKEADDDEEPDATMDEPLGDEKQEVLTMASLQALQKQVRAPVLSLKALKKVVRIFRGAVHIGSVAEARDGAAGGKKKTQSESAAAKEAAFRHEVAIHSPKVFHELVRFMLKDGVAVWQAHFKFNAEAKNKAGTSAPTLDKHPRWGTVGPVLKAFLGHLLFFLSTLRSNPAEAKMARFVLGALEGLVRFFEPFPRLAQKLLKELLEMWSAAEHNVRIDAFLRIRQLAIELTSGTQSRGGESMLELTLKGIYLTYVRNTKFTSILTMPVIEFMANCVVEIYGIDPVLSYQHAFVYIRQLAIHLRQALLAKKKDSHRMVYNWNFINCLRVWSKVLSVHGVASTTSSGQNGAVAAADNLQALVYPFVQVCLGTLTVLPSSRYFPLRFHVARFLIDLSSRCKVFVPLAPHLLAVFNAPELARKPTASTRKVSDILYVLKASKHVISTKTYQESVVNESLHLLLQYFNIFSYSIAFNELILPTVKLLKKHAKEVVIHRVRKQIQGFVLKLEHNGSWMAQKRNACNWAPKDLMDAKKGVDGIDTFRTSNDSDKKGVPQQMSPLDKYARTQAAERKILDETKADWNGTKTPKTKKKKDDSDDDEEDEDEKYDRKKRQENGDDDEDDDGEDDEDLGEDDDGYGDEDMEDDEEGEDDEEQPRKKTKTAAPHKPFEYPSSEDEEAGGDLLEELAFSDDEDSGASKKKKTNRGGVKKNKNKGKPAAAAATTPNKKAGDKRKRA